MLSMSHPPENDETHEENTSSPISTRVPKWKPAPARVLVTEYRDEYARFAEELLSLGGTDAHLIRALAVSEETLSAWREAHPEFADACRRASELADNAVERSLYQRAVGYETVETRVMLTKTGPIVVESRKHVLPDVKAGVGWLQQRRPAEWHRPRGWTSSSAKDPLSTFLDSLVDTTARPRGDSTPSKDLEEEEKS
jgi:hypothetical protein